MIDFAAYIPPIFSIALALYQVAVLDRALSARTRNFVVNEFRNLDPAIQAEFGQLADNIARDRVLQVAFLSTIFSAVGSLSVVMRESSASWLLWVLLAVFLAGLLGTVTLFLYEPGHLANTKALTLPHRPLLQYEHHDPDETRRDKHETRLIHEYTLEQGYTAGVFLLNLIVILVTLCAGGT